MAGVPVLVADDELLVRMLLRRRLEQAGHAVLEAASGAEALAVAAADPPGLALVDYHLGDRTAPELIRELRALPGLERLPVVVITGTERAAEVALAREAGAGEVLVKSRLGAELLPALARSLGNEESP